MIVAVTSSLAVWLFQSNERARRWRPAGLIFGYFGYVLTRGMIRAEPDRTALLAAGDYAIGLSYGYILTVAIPGAHRV